MNYDAEGQATLTRLAQAGPAAAPASRAIASSTARSNWLRDVILGGQDGLVNILGIVLGVIAGGGGKVVLLAAGFAAAITESISMGASGRPPRFPNATTTRPNKPASRPRSTPPPRPNGRRSATSTRPRASPGTCSTGSSTPSRRTGIAWLSTMMDEELHLQPVQTPDILRSAVVITIATLIGHLIPLLPFVWLPRATALITAVVLSAGVLFGVGVYSSVTLVGDWRKNGLKMVAIGLGAAAVGFLIGRLFHTAGA